MSNKHSQGRDGQQVRAENRGSYPKSDGPQGRHGAALGRARWKRIRSRTERRTGHAVLDFGCREGTQAGSYRRRPEDIPQIEEQIET